MDINDDFDANDFDPESTNKDPLGSNDDEQETDDDTSPDLHKGLKKAMVDLDRFRATQHGLVNKPQDAMKAKWATPLREQPWMTAVVVHVVYFARSNDYCADDLPYTKIAETAAAKGTPIPIDPSLAGPARMAELRRQVHRALDVLKGANEEWWEKNVEAQLRRRAAELESATLNDLEGELDEKSEEAESRSAKARLSRAIRRRGWVADTRAIQVADIAVACRIAARRLGDEAHAEGSMREAPSHRHVSLEAARDAALELEQLTADPSSETSWDSESVRAVIRGAAGRAAARHGWDADEVPQLAAEAAEELLRTMEVLPEADAADDGPEAGMAIRGVMAARAEPSGDRVEGGR